MDEAAGGNARPGSVDPSLVVGAFAAALDADDFESVTEMVDEEVVYRIGDVVHRGPAAVVASYRDGSALARRIFERVEYSHEVVGVVGVGTVRVDFADTLHAGGETLDHHSIQDVEVGRDGRIVSITDLPVERERDRVDAFMARHGLSRDSEPPPG